MRAGKGDRVLVLFIGNGQRGVALCLLQLLIVSFVFVAGFRGGWFGWWFSWPDLPLLLQLVDGKWLWTVDGGFDSVFVN